VLQQKLPESFSPTDEDRNIVIAFVSGWNPHDKTSQSKTYIWFKIYQLIQKELKMIKM